jgi:hypothetical protein
LVAYPVALFEIAVGLSNLISSSFAVRFCQAALYTLLVGVLLLLRRQGSEVCGCFGGNAPPSILHLVFNLAVAAASWGLLARDQVDSLFSLLRGSEMSPVADGSLVVLLVVSTNLLLQALSRASHDFHRWQAPVQSKDQWRFYPAAVPERKDGK